MSLPSVNDRVRRTIILFLLGVGTALAAALLYVGIITHKIDTRIEQLRTAKGTQFFAEYPALKKGQNFSTGELRHFLEDQGYREKSKSDDDLLAHEFRITSEGDRRSVMIHRPAFAEPGAGLDQKLVRILLAPLEKNRFLIEDIVEIRRGVGETSIDALESLPKKLGAFFAGRLRTQLSVALSEIPVAVRYAVMAIEDVGFLDHPGVSFRALVRALWTDLRKGRFAEGGSTITQQLMKLLFFSSDKVLSRKIKEAVFAFITEMRHSKEDILEAYLNEVYLGQWATHQIHGISEGARYYFNRDVSEVSLAQAATLAAIIQAPNVHDPRKYVDKVTKRRNTVLERMLKAGFILPDEYDMALKEKLAVISPDRSLEDVDYFMDLVMEKLPAGVKGSLDRRSLTLYTTLNPYLQTAASRHLRANIERLRGFSPAIAKREKAGTRLQGALIAVDVKNCSVVALQGGISYKQTQFNRALQGKRQPGSLFKPFVYLAAFDKGIEGVPISPLTTLEDTPFEWKYDGQTWKPRNYEEKYHDKVTAREALENSLNAATARLAFAVGLEPILEELTKAGITSPLPQVPSISLGSADVSPIEMATAFTTLANLGRGCTLRAYTKIFDENGNMTYEVAKQETQRLPVEASFQTVQLMKGVMQRGTAKWVSALGLPHGNFAVKTGTTNDNKDAWFVGFSPEILAVTWIGYDEETKLGLTGSVAALPLWVDFMKTASPFLTQEDFAAPADLIELEIDPETHAIATSHCPEKRVEYFVRGTEPQDRCPIH